MAYKNVGIAALAFAAALAIATPANGETLDNNSVVALVGAGLGDEAVIAKIDGSATHFDTSTAALIALKNAGVSSAVIAKMIAAGSTSTVSENASASLDNPDPRAPHPAGVYLLGDWLQPSKMLVIDATTSNQTKSGGFLGYALTGGIASMSFKTAVPNAHARVQTRQARPTFYFYFDQANRSLSNGARDGFWAAGAVTSPAEFSLVRFDVKKNSREAKVGSFNIGGAKAGVMDKDRIPFTYNLVVPGVYEVRPSLDLQGGEYGFLYSASTGGGVGLAGVGAMTSRIFDFSVTQ
ncbi:MAG: hypothetical protein ACTHKM_01275 [Tsuneonella sp.]